MALLVVLFKWSTVTLLYFISTALLLSSSTASSKPNKNAAFIAQHKTDTILIKNNNISIRKFIVSKHHQSSTILSFSSHDNNNNDGNNVEPWINPFQQQRQSEQQALKNPFENRNANIIEKTLNSSPRKRKMDALMGDLLRCPSDEASMRDVLRRYGDFLTEPFDNDDYNPALFETESIYEKGMTRGEKVERYREIMTERVAAAKNEGVRRVLRVMMDFVLEKCAAAEEEAAE